MMSPLSDGPRELKRCECGGCPTGSDASGEDSDGFSGGGGGLVFEGTEMDDGDDDVVDGSPRHVSGVDRTLDDIFNAIAEGEYVDDVDSDESDAEEVDAVVHRVRCGTCERTLTERAQCVNLVADARQWVYSTDIPDLDAFRSDHDAVLPIDTCECIAEKVHCAACDGQVGYHVTQVCAVCDRLGHNGHFWMFHAELVRADAMEADEARKGEDGELMRGLLENVESSREGDDAVSHAHVMACLISCQKAVGEAAAAASAAAEAKATSASSDKNEEQENVSGSKAPTAETTADADASGTPKTLTAAVARTWESLGSETKRERRRMEACPCNDAATRDENIDPPTPTKEPLLLWSALPYNGAPLATGVLLAETHLVPPPSIVCTICASVMHKPVKLRTCCHPPLCWGCARREVDARGVCPFDRRPLVADDLLPDEPARAAVKKFIDAAAAAARENGEGIVGERQGKRLRESRCTEEENNRDDADDERQTPRRKLRRSLEGVAAAGQSSQGPRLALVDEAPPVRRSTRLRPPEDGAR